MCHLYTGSLGFVTSLESIAEQSMCCTFLHEFEVSIQYVVAVGQLRNITVHLGSTGRAQTIVIILIYVRQLFCGVLYSL